MKNFEWASAKSIDEALEMLRSAPKSRDPDEAPRPIAGGQDLLTTMKEYIERPPRVVNLKAISELGQIEASDKGLKIGALVTLSELEQHPEVRKSYPGLAQAAQSVATSQIRNLGTVGGNLCQRPRCWYFRLEHVICLKKGGSRCYAADEQGENKFNAILGGGPSYIVHPSDLAPMLVALGASVTIAGDGGARRDLPLEEFFTLPSEGNLRRENVLKPGEIITHVIVPASPAAARSTYLKFKERDSLDFATVSVAAAVELADDKTVKSARLALGGVAPIPWRVENAESALAGKKLESQAIAEAATIALEGAKPLSKNAYKVPLTQALVRRALSSLAS